MRPHGVRGELLVEPLSDSIRSLEAESVVFLGRLDTPFVVMSLRPHRGQFLLRLVSVSDRTQAEQIRSREILIPFDQATPLPEGVYYHRQILGLDVVELGGKQLGQVSEILETGGNDVYVVQPEGGRELLLPAISSVILEIDLEAGRIVVAVPEGLEPDE